MEEFPNWVSFSADTKYLARCGFGDIEKELKDVLDSDLFEIVFMDDKEDVEDQINSYVFVRCKNYFRHVPNLKKCKFIINAVETFDNPYFIPECQIEKFKKTLNDTLEEQKPNSFLEGDIVKVIDGYLKNIFGVIVGEQRKDFFIVNFRFHSRILVEVLPTKSLEYCGNFFDKLYGESPNFEGKIIRNPVLRDDI